MQLTEEDKQVATDPYKVWANMKLKIWPERYWMVDLMEADAGWAAEVVSTSVERYSCIIRDQAGLSVVVDGETWENLGKQVTPRDQFGPFKIVSTDGNLPFDVIGFLQPALKELNTQGIKAGPQCGAVFDHLFIYEKDVTRAEEILNAFISEANNR